jgi:uncharacterized RDD family membrane protein YckC
MENESQEFKPENMPQEGTPEFEEFMKLYYGDDYEIGYRVNFWKRAGAYIIDLIILAFIGAMVVMNNDTFKSNFANIMDGNVDPFDSEFMESFTQANLEIAPILLLIKFFYFSTEIFFAQSFGKMIFGLKIGNQNRTKADLTQLLIRYFTKYIDIVLGLVFVLTTLSLFNTIGNIAGYIVFFGYFMVFRRERQALHDLPGKTTVFHKNAIKLN